MEESIVARIKALTKEDNRLPCVTAHQIAASLGVDPLQVGKAADQLGVRIWACQMGLFGYGQKPLPEYRLVRPAESVPDDLAVDLRGAVVNGKLPCAAAWAIADRYGLSYLEVANAIEALGLKVKPCQLGCF
ncbi:MAG: hypothetical protein NUW24_02405 [Anaerolineae bacterium]|jgi:hypothetical protein|nr:hypothetical protein [Anaerolineae bacterium]MDH7473854.1 hypothetical protein [Anaerolineae bacterium]